jgi:hypothetical protein
VGAKETPEQRKCAAAARLLRTPFACALELFGVLLLVRRCAAITPRRCDSTELSAADVLAALKTVRSCCGCGGVPRAQRSRVHRYGFKLTWVGNNGHSFDAR